MRLGGYADHGGGAAWPIDDPGSGERLLNLALERYGVWLRSTVVCLCGALGVVSADATEIPLAVSLLVPALLACGVRLCSLRRPLPFPLPLALLWTLDAAVVVLTGLSQPVLGGVGADVTVEAIIGICVITFQHEWATRPVAAAALAATGTAACALGDILSSPGAGPEPAELVRIVVLAGLSRAAYLIVRAQARAADRSAALGAAARREAEVAAARRATEREYLATLHDTASATLLMVSQGDARDWSWLPPRARQDLQALSAVPGFETGNVDLAALLGCVPEGTAGEGEALVQLKTRIDGPLAVPSGPGLAIFNGVREAVTNVARHSGVREAELRAWTEQDGAVVVELSDAGRGFDPGCVPERRRGISGSVIGRMHAVGGTATVTSAPGTGTRVRWRWHSRARTPSADHEAQPADLPRQTRAGAHTAVARLIRRQLLHGAQLAALLISLLSQFVLSLQQITAHQGAYRPAWAQTAAFVCLAAVAACGAVFLLRGRQIPPRVRAWSLASVLTVSAVCAFTLAPERLTGPQDWAFGLVGWHALFLLADLPVRAFAAFLGAHVGINAIAVLLSGAPTAAESAAMGIAAITTCGFQFSVGILLTRLLHGTAPAAGDEAAREEELRTRERIHEDMQRDHKERYRALTATTVPLLMGLGHGVLSPHDEEVRLRCRVEAARMRRLFAESDAVSDPLLNELRACVEVAEHQGVAVSLAVRGRPGEVPREARRALIDPVVVTLGRTRSTARVTVVWTSREVRVSVVGTDRSDGRAPGEASPPPGPATAANVSVTRTARGGSVWVEASWSKRAAPEVDLT
ncbi:sensor histidine kinase [Streptomyces sp. WAC 05379]|uniref:sensor histidine kinase n=1 Tax=Streptomyces sp. WAC 05379 TaxID=2203207 RepID=UPI0021ADBD7C|nr:ATP-binding protein [Streptomyces sp. WAC 05379]